MNAMASKALLLLSLLRSRFEACSTCLLLEPLFLSSFSDQVRKVRPKIALDRRLPEGKKKRTNNFAAAREGESWRLY